MSSATRGIYVHIPFCTGKCSYCAFNSYPSTGGVPERYIDALIWDARSEARRWPEGEFRTIYFGGGTPSLLTRSQLERILGSLKRHYRVAADAEITIECNPDTLSPEKLMAFGDLGITRISIGIQSVSRSELAMLGRSHDPEYAVAMLEHARTLGIFRVSVDAIVGIPGQTKATLELSLGVLGKSADHISVYILSIEPGTQLERLVRQGSIDVPDDDEVMGLYGHACRLLAGLGLEHYEISNWCRPGHECAHNRIYWKRGDYVGLGAGAHSHRAGVRYARLRRPAAYIDAVAGGTMPIGMREVLTRRQMLLEEVMLGLRTSDGIDLDDMASRYGADIDRMDCLLGELAECGLIVKDQSNLLLSPRGIAVHDSISEALAAAISS